MNSKKKNKKLSLYRTEHEVPFYREISSEQDAIYAIKDAQNSRLNVYILGNGSNTFFENRVIRSAILKNSFPRIIEPLPENKFYISSSVLVSEVLKYCYKLQLDCFYYLASVPAEIGGALAMNAGQGRAFGGESIMNFVEEIRFIQNGKIIVKKPEELAVSYRSTIFTGQTDLFILGATFNFSPVAPFQENPIKARIEWAKEKQDLSKPNCGTVFKVADGRIMSRLRGIRLFGASFSKKTNNWIVNQSKSPLGIKLLMYIVIILHRILLKKCEAEVISVK